ncbi:MAG: hypothetical protein ACTHXG_14455 [Micrococcaceae bacterium]
MRSYETKIGGYTVRQQYSDETAERMGLKPAPKKKPEPEPVETKKVEPENKGRGRGRTIKRD